MAIPIISMIISTIAIFVGVVSRSIRRKKAQELEREPIRFNSDFSVFDYLGRMEKASIEIMLESNKRPKYQLVLWAGLDGLRVNDDGTTEWIRREQERPKAISRVQDCMNVAQFMDSFPALQNSINSPPGAMQTMLALQSQDFSIRQSMIQSQMMNTILPTYVHTPYPYYTYPYYQSAVTQCCAIPKYN